MCGIAGFIGFENNPLLAQQANSIQQHRGPDNQSLWQDDYIALAHQRLSIIDLSERSNQPFCKHNLVMIYNGELYNYIDLQKKLQLEKGVIFTTTSDTEVVLEMYLHFGENCLQYFEGMFAFAIYDKLSKKLFIARDHFGIKPLFYYSDNTSKFAFASELKTLASIQNINKSINTYSLAGSLNYLWVPDKESMFNEFKKLPPAHYLDLSPNSNAVIKKYWEVEPKISNASEQDLIDDLKSTFEKSMNMHMVSDVPVSAFLSGGLDSSLIAVLAQKQNKNLSTYTIKTTEKDKRIEKMPEDDKYAKKLANQFGFKHHEIEINPDIIKLLPFIVKTLDEPIGDPAAINTYLICEAARKDGVKVLLSGMGADELFGGYRRHQAMLYAHNYKWILSVLGTTVAKPISELLPVRIGNKGVKLTRWAKRFLSFSNLPTDTAYMRSYSYYSHEELKKIFAGDHFTETDKLYSYHNNLFNAFSSLDVINKMCYTDISMFMYGLNLTYSDRASMAASVEVRVPFITKSLVEKAMTIPGSLKIKNGQSKYILKKVAENYLPKEIIYRPKASFGAPLRSWISDELKGFVDDLLSPNSIKNRGFFNPQFVQNLINEDRKGYKDNAYQIYQLLTIELWMREYLDQKPYVEANKKNYEAVNTEF